MKRKRRELETEPTEKKREMELAISKQALELEEMTHKIQLHLKLKKLKKRSKLYRDLAFAVWIILRLTKPGLQKIGWIRQGIFSITQTTTKENRTYM